MRHWRSPRGVRRSVQFSRQRLERPAQYRTVIHGKIPHNLCARQPVAGSEQIAQIDGLPRILNSSGQSRRYPVELIEYLAHDLETALHGALSAPVTAEQFAREPVNRRVPMPP